VENDKLIPNQLTTEFVARYGAGVRYVRARAAE